MNSGTYSITSANIRIANQIFVEHKNQKLIIAEQSEQIKFYDQKILYMTEKDSIMNQLVLSKNSEIQNIQQTSIIKERKLNEEIQLQKKNKNLFKLATFGLAALAIIAGFAK